MPYVSDVARAIDRLNSAQLSALGVRTSLMSIPTLARDLNGLQSNNLETDLSYEDNLVFVTLAAFCASITTVLVFDRYLQTKEKALNIGSGEIAHRFANGDFWNDPAARELATFSDYSGNLGSTIQSMLEYAFWEIKSCAPGIAQTSSELVQRLGTGHDIRKGAADVYHNAFQVTNTADLGNAFIADAERFQKGASIHDVLSAPLFLDLPKTSPILHEWVTLQNTLAESSVVDWGNWRRWLQCRINGDPIDMEQQLRWGSIFLDEYPQASEFGDQYT